MSQAEVPKLLKLTGKKYLAPVDNIIKGPEMMGGNTG